MASDNLIASRIFRGKGIALYRIPILSWLFRGLLALILLMSFRTFQGFPGMRYLQEVWFVLCWLAFAFFFLPWKAKLGLRFSAFESYILLLMFASTFVSSWCAWREFGQPISYGILIGRGAGAFVVGLLCINVLRRRIVRLADIEAALLFLAWSTFALYSTMRLTLNPANFISYGVAFVAGGDSVAKATFKLPPYLIIFGAIYYALHGIRTRRIGFYFAAGILFLFGADGLTERALTLSFAMTLLFFLFCWRRTGDFIIAAGKFLCVATLATVVAWIVSPNSISARASKFSDAFTVVLTGSNVEDSSANTRLIESVMALPYIQKHPMLGNGAICHQWNGGAQGTVGDYFYETDLGVIGVVFSYGAIGFLIYALQYPFALRSSIRVRAVQHSPMLDATKGFVLFTALFSLTTGFFVWNAEITLFFVALLIGIARQMESNEEHAIPDVP